VVRGKQSLRVECAPAFHYALHEHKTSLVSDDTIPANGEKNASDKQKRALFESEELTLDLRFIAESVIDGVPLPSVNLQILDLMPRGHKGLSIGVDLDLVEGQVVTFVLRTPPKATKEQYNASSTKEQFEQQGVSFDRECDLELCILCYNTGHGRTAKCDQPPQERGSPTYQGLSPVSSYSKWSSRLQRSSFTICCMAPMTTGMRGFGVLPMMALGKKRFIVARSR
jgi:hypothetical protein